MQTALVFHPDMSAYRFGGPHPFRPERFELAVALMEQWALIGPPESTPGSDYADVPSDDRRAAVIVPTQCGPSVLGLAHSPEYINAVRRASDGMLDSNDAARFGIGPGDTPAFLGMHEAAALAVGGTVAALDAVIGGQVKNAFNPAGGLHHAHRDHASGFCVYNDCAVAIQKATEDHPGLRVAYVDIDAHHGDGVEAAFLERSDVLTLSIHESGQFLFPGSGRLTDTGRGEGTGFALNVPLPPYADPACYDAVLERVVKPALETFRPDVLFVQAGADSHRDDPLTHLHQSVKGFHKMIHALIGCAEALCDGRIAMAGGGGYDTFSAVPRMWACAMAALSGSAPPDTLPPRWLTLAQEMSETAGEEWHPIESTFGERTPDLAPPDAARLLHETMSLAERLRTQHPLFA